MPALNMTSIPSISVISFLYCYMKGDLDDASCLYKPLRYILPWNQQTVDGWAYEIIFCSCLSSLYLFVVYIFVSFFASFSLHCGAYQEYFQTLMNNIDKSVCKKNYPQSTHQLYAAIRFRNTAKRYHFHWKRLRAMKSTESFVFSAFLDFADLYSGTIFCQIICITVFLASSLFIFDIVSTFVYRKFKEIKIIFV